MEKKLMTLASMAMLLSACSTTSFAPPPVNLKNAMEVSGSNRLASQSCRPYEMVIADRKVPVVPGTQGALILIQNYVLYYRCRAHSAGNGRQIFEVPAFLGMAGAVTATAFGAGSDPTLAAGALGSVLGGGKAYYAPKEKAKIYDSALDALLCIKTRAVGVDPFILNQASALEQNADGSPRLTGGVVAEMESRSGRTLTRDELAEVSFTPSRQYFEMVMAALMSVERIAAQRLSETGVFDPAGVVAEINALAKQEETARADATPGATAKVATLTNDAAQQRTASEAILSLATLQPQLQTCVVRAKL